MIPQRFSIFRSICAIALCIVCCIRTSSAAENVDELTAGVEENPADSARKLAGKSGIIVRLTHSERDRVADYVLSHPLVDAIVAPFYWSEIEVSPSQFEFGPIDRILEICRRNKKNMVLEIPIYGMDGERNFAPEWLYELGVKRIVISDLKTSREMTTPRVWDSACSNELGKFVRKLGERYQREPAIWYVVPDFGYISGTGVFPSRDGFGITAMRKEGWSIEIWKDLCLKVTGYYQAAFPDTPLLMPFPRYARYDLGGGQIRDICAALAKRNVSAVALGIDADLERHKKNNPLWLLEPFARYPNSVRLGLGEESPLWLPPERRAKEITDRDEEGMKRLIDHAFGGIADLPRTHITILYVSYTEIDACHPKNKAPNKAVFDILQKAHDRLKEEDRSLFGK